MRVVFAIFFLFSGDFDHEEVQSEDDDEDSEDDNESPGERKLKRSIEMLETRLVNMGLGF